MPGGHGWLPLLFAPQATHSLRDPWGKLLNFSLTRSGDTPQESRGGNCATPGINRKNLLSVREHKRQGGRFCKSASLPRRSRGLWRPLHSNSAGWVALISRPWKPRLGTVVVKPRSRVEKAPQGQLGAGTGAFPRSGSHRKLAVAAAPLLPGHLAAARPSRSHTPVLRPPARPPTQTPQLAVFTHS